MALIKRIIGHIIIIGHVSSHVMDFTFIKSKNVLLFAWCHHPIVKRPSAGSIWRRQKKTLPVTFPVFSTLCSQPIHYGFESWSCTCTLSSRNFLWQGFHSHCLNVDR